jgi:ATP-dependent HslUV protease ATP-binding subunit HslU
LIYYRELLAAEGVRLEWEEAALRRLARWAEVLNQRLENLGAGRLRSILSHLLEDVLYRLPESRRRRLRITVKMVEDALRDVFPSEDLSRFVL